MGGNLLGTGPPANISLRRLTVGKALTAPARLWPAVRHASITSRNACRCCEPLLARSSEALGGNKPGMRQVETHHSVQTLCPDGLWVRRYGHPDFVKAHVSNLDAESGLLQNLQTLLTLKARAFWAVPRAQCLFRNARLQTYCHTPAPATTRFGPWSTVCWVARPSGSDAAAREVVSAAELWRPRPFVAACTIDFAPKRPACARTRGEPAPPCLRTAAGLGKWTALGHTGSHAFSDPSGRWYARP